MITILLTASIIFLVAIYVFLVRLFKKTRFYREVCSLRQVLTGVPQELRSKRDVRKYRKLKPYIKSLRRRAVVVTLVYTLLFLVFYLASLTITWLIGSVFNTFFTKSPVGLPLLSFLDTESGYFVIPIYVNTILILTGVLYIFIREAKLD
jgi:hypothetical protein